VAVDLNALVEDLDAETRLLDTALASLDDAGWETPTPAPGWRVHDQIVHLAYFDEMATLAASDRERFLAEAEIGRDDPDGIIERITKRESARPHADVLAWFRASRAAMVDTFRALDPSARVPWYGPEMSVASSLTARIMETWAHGQDVFDALGRTHEPTRALRNVAHIGVRAFPNSFITRGLTVPDTPIFVALNAPNGEQWTWGDPTAGERVEGDATEFCLVATQRINVADTDLTVTGPIATQWMQIAQASAGAPGPGRAPRA
jgi:uncharacterized protein (TIGR03084 family)